MKSSALAIAIAGYLFAPITSQAGPQDAALVGKWALTGMKLAGQEIDCPGELPLPPGVPDIIKQYAKCNAGESIQLSKRRTRGTYYEDITNIPTTSPNGTWTAIKEKQVDATKTLPEIPAANYMIFDDSDNTNDPQVYLYDLSRNKKTLTISKSVGLQGVRYPVELILTKQK